MPEDGSKKGPRPKNTHKESGQSFGMPLGPKGQIEVTLPDTLVVVLTSNALSQLFSYAEATDLEVSPLGIVTRDQSQFSISDFFLVEQKGANDG